VGRFWIFEGNLRPKIAKAGFYTILLKSSDTVILEIREAFTEEQFHVREIQEILEKLEFQDEK
jgi:hypothetical protein